MPFGFDPSIILAATRQQDDGGDLMRLFSEMPTRRLQVQQGQASLAELARQQQERRTLADLYRRNSGSFSDPLATSLAGAGFGERAFEAQTKADNLTKMHRELIRNRLATVKDAAGYARAIAGISPQGLAHIGLTDQYDKDAIAAFLVPAEKRAEWENEAEQKRLDRAAAKERASIVAGGLAGKLLSPTALGELADYDTAIGQVDEIFAKAEKENISGLGAKASQMVTDALGLQHTKPAQFEGAAAPVRQGVGTILEGGKLAAGDEVKYKNMLPKYGDSPEVLAEKKKALRSYLETRKAEKSRQLKAGGYNVPSAAPGGAPAPGSVLVRRKSDGKTRAVSAEDAKRFLKSADFEAVK